MLQRNPILKSGLLQGGDTYSEVAKKACAISLLSIPPYVLLEATAAEAQAWVKSLFLRAGGRGHANINTPWKRKGKGALGGSKIMASSKLVIASSLLMCLCVAYRVVREGLTASLRNTSFREHSGGEE